MIVNFKKILRTTCLTLFLAVFATSVFFFPYQNIVQAQQPGDIGYYNKSTLFISPANGTFLLGSTFDVSFILDTGGESINAFSLNLKFPPDKLAIVGSFGGKSIASVWAVPPVYSNAQGTAHLEGGIPGGIKTKAGIIATLTFQAKTPGQAVVEILPESQVLANDGLGTTIPLNLGRGNYSITPRPPEGVKVFSDTHPFQEKWYNNNNPVISWTSEEGITDFSYELDNKPNTIPDNVPDSQSTTKAYENLDNGMWYFHIKARKNNIWGPTTHYVLRIDTTPPASFKPRVELLTATIIARAFVYFFTTDSLSGLDHYEVGVVDRSKSQTESPVFIEAESPYQLPNEITGALRVIVRAVDEAGNVRDESADVYEPSPFNFIRKNLKTIAVLFLALLIFLIFHYLFGHKVFSRQKKSNEIP